MSTIPDLMPDYWVNEKGASQRVIAAIIKPVKWFADGEQKEGSWIARCGAASKGCRGVIGSFGVWGVIVEDLLPGWASRPNVDEGTAWRLQTHPGFRRAANGGYRVVRHDGRRNRSGQRIGARSLPRRMDHAVDFWVESNSTQYVARSSAVETNRLEDEDPILAEALAEALGELWERTTTPHPPIAEDPSLYNSIWGSMPIPEGGRVRDIIGQFPEPPSIVYCPQCDRPNWVEAPPIAPPAWEPRYY